MSQVEETSSVSLHDGGLPDEWHLDPVSRVPPFLEIKHHGVEQV
jgi:hypothetical protein